MEACESNYKKKSLTKEMGDLMEVKRQIIFYGISEEAPSGDEYLKIKSLIDRIKQFSKDLVNKKEGQNPKKKDDLSIKSEEVESS